MSILKKIKYFLADTNIEKAILPFYNNYFPQKDKTGGSSEGEYVLQIFLLQTYFLKVKNYKKTNSLNFNTICEFGPGDSVAIGLLYMIIYKSKYVAFDAYPYFDKGVSFKACSKALEHLKNIDTSSSLALFLRSNRFSNSIDISNLFRYLKQNIIPNIKDLSSKDISDAITKIEYHAPYNLDDHKNKYQFDLIFSQAVLEHCDNLSEIYKFQKSNLHYDGVSYNHIDFKSHGTSFRWNGQYSISNKLYKSLEKSNTFQWINRMPISHHQSLIKEVGLKTFEVVKFKYNEGIGMEKVSKDMQSFIKDLDDLDTHSSIVMSRRDI